MVGEKSSKIEGSLKGKATDDEVVEARSRLRASLIARLDELSAGIRSEQDLDRLKKMLDCAEGLLRVLRSM